MNLAFAATMIRPRYLPDSIVAQLVSVSAFLHSLDPKRTCGFRNILAEACKPEARTLPQVEILVTLRSARYRKERPSARHTFQTFRTFFSELNPGAYDQILHSIRNPR